MKNIIIVLMIILCAQIVLAQSIDTSVNTSTKGFARDIAVDTSINTSTNIAEDIAADTSINTSTDIAEDIATDTSITTSVKDAAINDDDDDDDERILAEIVLDTSKLIKPELIKREHDYRRQTNLAVVMMIFIAVILTTTQSWNPR